VDVNNLVSPITQWYVDAFFTNGFGFDVNNAAGNIMNVGRSVNGANFNNVFRVIAANPVGRVLLYRLLIEIRRQDGGGSGCCGDGIVVLNSDRDAARSVQVVRTRPDCFEFEPYQHRTVIRFGTLPINGDCLRIVHNVLSTVPVAIPFDVILFHEMLHWFQLLRHPVRFDREDAGNCAINNGYTYLSRCYYGDISECFSWDGKIDHQEIRTILGAPDYNTPAELALFHPNALLPVDPGGGIAVGASFLPSECFFYSGDDLSENAYRMAKHAAAGAAGAGPVHMCFGHSGGIASVNFVGAPLAPPDRFRLAHLVATRCCNAVVNLPITNWTLISGEAAQ
jgi:hypothetical protein